MKPRDQGPTMERVRAAFACGQPLTHYQIAGHVFVDVKNARFYCRILHEKREIHITEWTRSAHGPWFPIYAPGEGKDAKKPSDLTPTQRAIRDRNRQRARRKNELVMQKERARARSERLIKKTLAAPSMLSVLVATLKPRKHNHDGFI